MNTTANNINQYLPFLKDILTPQRLQHSLDVMKVMGDLAEIYQLERMQAMIAGLLHDAAKDLGEEEQLALADEAGIAFNYPCERHPIYLHASVGAYLVGKELGIRDITVIDAIATHSYANNGDNSDSTFSWCLRSADVLAPVREWFGMNKLKSVVYAGQMTEAALLQCGWLIEYFQRNNIPVHPHLTHTFQSLHARVNVDNAFFDR